MKYVSTDLETTGLVAEECQTLEIGAIVSDTSDRTTPILELPKFHCLVWHPIVKGDPFAMALNARILKEIAGKRPYLQPEFASDGTPIYTVKQAVQAFKTFLIEHFGELKCINVAGKNFNKLDRPFLAALDKEFQEAFRARVLDPAILYVLPEDECLPGTETCLQRAGLDPNVSHKALEDAGDIIRLIRRGLRYLWAERANAEEAW